MARDTRHRQYAEFVMPTGPITCYELKMSDLQRLRFCDVVRARMKLYGHTLRDLARLTGYSFSTVEKFFRNPKLTDCGRGNRFLAAALAYMYEIDREEYTTRY